MPVHSYAAFGPREPLKPHTFELGAVAPNDVEIAVSHCGICHTDLHLIDNDWGFSSFPLTPGHEAVGEVVAVGSAVKSFKRGDRVGIGWLAGSCGSCESCLEGHENTCAAWRPTCVAQPGGFADRLRADHRLTFEIPKEIKSEEAGPLMCGGATMFTPLEDHDVKDGARVGIVSIGGLGHMGLQFARARGCRVTAFSTSPSKESEAREMGASDFAVLSDSEAMNARAGSLDFIVTTTPSDLPWDTLIGLLKPRGTLCVVGIPPNAVQFQAFPLLATHKKIVGSNTGSVRGIKSMLATAAKKGVKPFIERHAMGDVNTALERLRKNEVRYRAVLVN
ncbi:MAG TPA: NAD(P)-dependent alcohol dehydrogenase [Gemmatimonadaceae bacterium]|nr:NAD(P)-dependent alcohol dehydrogenase [Gemmatimonadaceae bacterium]